eukprot:Em0006g1138a
MLFALVLHKLVSSIEADDDCINLSFNAWYLDDGILPQLVPQSYPTWRLGAPIGDIVHCSSSLLRKQSFKVYCKLVHLARTTPTNLCEDSLKFFDEEKWGTLHDNSHLQQAILCFNTQVSPQDSITMESVLNSPPQQKSLSQKLDSFAFHSLLSSASLVNKARMLSVSSPHASSWITAILSTSLKLYLDSAEYQTAIRWWLGLNASEASPCPFCPELIFDPLGHHAASCRHGGDVITRHNRLCNIFVEFCHQAHLSVRVEAGFGLSRAQRNTRSCSGLAMLRDASTSAGSEPMQQNAESMKPMTQSARSSDGHAFL